MNTLPEISVVTPSNNQAPFIEQKGFLTLKKFAALNIRTDC